MIRIQAAAATLSLLLLSVTASADPWHKFRRQDAFWHHGSGFVFPRHVGQLELIGTPAEIDGNIDIIVEYAVKGSASLRAATVGLYAPTSAAPGAKLDTARAALQAETDAKKCATSVSEKNFELTSQSGIAGTKIELAPKAGDGANCVASSLYFFQAAHWIISVRTAATAMDSDAARVFDEFVRALRWETLDTDPLQSDLGA